ncbi:adenylate/guanylate cyclase domain-containing protein [Sinorhizobium meliloti]|uniref:adenylate/guanylate cyclase domain-containing protein n=1 Tax=Rhizobium meliloti TaxID=382 RepID=UPI001F1D8DD6|nr:adenylate/guanylate cyclase domain-containing protein [Sinorhizobium meliloti]
MGAIGVWYFATLSMPAGVWVLALMLALAAIGLLPLMLIGGPLEKRGRYALFAFDVTVISTAIAFGPVFTAEDLPQNFVFLASRQHYYYVILAASILTLSPGIVAWTGFCSVVGLAAATAWIATGMERVVSYSDLPPRPTLEEYLTVVLDTNFLNIPVRFNEGVVLTLVTCVAALAVHRARTVARAYADAEAKRNRIQQLFGRYVPVQVAERLIVEGQLAPQLREASVLFADIEGFTAIGERLPPTRLIELLNDFFGAATTVIDTEGGVVVNYVGDALIAAFNAPLPVEGYPLRAVAAARSLHSLVARREFGGQLLRLRIGVATGPVAAGTVGGAKHQAYTLYGDTVNLAQRLEHLNKEFGTDCLICRKTFDAARSDCFDAVAVGSMQVRGREAAVEVFALNDGRRTS